jgi:hypothetical protein
VTALADWLEQHTARAPAELRARVVEYALAVPSPEPLPAALAGAARQALARVVAHPGNRAVALDLLAADALITLALLAQAQLDPGELSAFATSILQAVRHDA